MAGRILSRMQNATPMPQDISDVISSLTSLGGDAAAANHQRFSADLATLLENDPIKVIDRQAFQAALVHGFSYYYWKWDPRAVCHLRAVENAVIKWARAPFLDIDMLCVLADFHFFLVWCFNQSSTEQCQAIMRGMRAAAAGFARIKRSVRTLPEPHQQVHVLFLSMFASRADPMSVALRHIAPALMSCSGQFRLSVVAWRFSDPDFLEWLRSLGCACHAIPEVRPSATIAQIEAIAQADPPEIAISDMNNAIPTALFSRGLAPAQVFLQAGLPAWPVRPLDAVFNSFGFDATAAGWGEARMLSFRLPWDLAKLNPPEDEKEVARERERLPRNLRLIGNYGRLIKNSKPCLLAAERILEQCPDVVFVTGGTGDPSALREFIARSPVGPRMHVVEGYVPGQSWGRFLDVFLDTWPVTGGESCREMIAKGKPVITKRSAEMPAIEFQRDPTLVAEEWSDYVRVAVQLLQDQGDYQAACSRAAGLARSMADPSPFAEQLAGDLELVMDDVRKRPSAGST